MPRKYELKVRAQRQAETRQRIVDAAVELHRTLGPAETTLSAVASLAGVQRHTLYRHFPGEAQLLLACRDHFHATHPPPEVAAWREIEDVGTRVRHGLSELYGYYAANVEMIWHVLRDADRLPVGEGFRRIRRDAAAALIYGHELSGKDLEAVALVAADFMVWRALAQDSGLSLEQTVDVMATFVVTALRPRLACP